MKKLNCIRCNTQMTEHAVHNALMEVVKVGSQFKIIDDKSLPVLPYICGNCGYTELYVNVE